MKLSHIIKEHTTATKLVFAAEPPITKQVFDTLCELLRHKRIRPPELKREELIFNAELIQFFQSPDKLEKFNACLAQAYELVAGEQQQEAKERNSYLTEFSKRFGVPVK
jgi:hypothetical protein